MGGADGHPGPTDLALGATLDERGSPVLAGVPKWLGDRYRVVRVLGRGGMGVVYLAVDEALNAEVALKAIAADIGDALPRLRDEVRLAQKVTHANVCRTYDLEEIENNWLVKMEYVAGETLAERLKNGPLPVTEAVRVAMKVCGGLAAAHEQGVVHRDLKPHNIMIETGTGRVMLMDFGIARAAALAGKTAENVSGTPDYMAPEQVRGREVDGRADLYSLGCVLYEMLTGERVFPHTTAMAAALAHVNDPAPALPSSVPPRVARVVARLLEKEPARRPSDAAEVAAMLAAPPRRMAWWLAAGVMLATTVVALVAMRPRPQWQAQIRELPVYDEDSDAPVFSPDGKLIAYFSDREQPGRYRVYVMSLEGGPPRAVTPREQNASFPRWTRDGKALLYSEDTGRAFRVALDGGMPEPIAEAAMFVEDCGGRLLILYGHAPGCAQCPRFALREADGQEREIIRFPASAQFWMPRCDRTGQHVLYSRSDTGAPGPWYRPYDLWLLTLEGGGTRRLTDDHAFNMGTFTPDGRAIVFSAVHAGKSHLWQMPIDRATEPVQLTFGPGMEYEPDVSPNGRMVLFQVDNSDFQLFEQLLAGGRARKLTVNALNVLRHLQPTADGRAIIAQASPLSLHPEIVSIPLDGGDLVSLVEGSSPALTLDGEEILYCVEDRVLALPRNGGTSRLVTRAPGRVDGMNVGSDGRVHMMVLRLQSFEAWSAPVVGGDAERELPAPWSQLVAAPRGGWRVAIQFIRTSPNRARILAPGAPLDDPAARELAADAITWAPDGLSFLYARDGHVRRMWVESGEDRDVGEYHNFEHVALSTDGKTLYWTQLAGHVRRQLITNFAERR